MDNERNENKAAKAMRFWFGIFMVLFYVGIGILLIIANKTFVMFTSTTTIIVGVILTIYGIWRGYRLYKGID
jgi:cytochrome c biogenesis protein CcdA